MTDAAATGAAADAFEYVCELAELEENAIRRIVLGGRDVNVVRTSAGVFAFGNSCPHQGGPMCYGRIRGTMEPSERNEYQFGKAGEVVVCPWHGYEFDLRTGGSIGGTLPGRLAAYEVDVREDGVFVSQRRVRPPRRLPR
jgi:nitrite reductase (NADH) small subunit